jgi:hypothetical protein
MADYASLQKLALSDKGQDEAVTVNQRALIGFLPQSIRSILTNRQNPRAVCLGQHDIARTSSKCRRRQCHARQNPLPDSIAYARRIRITEQYTV